jgi:hypothetical protein
MRRRLSHRQQGFIGYVPSIKMGTMLGYRSLTGSDYAMLLDFDPAVQRIESPSITIPYQDGPHMHTCHADFYVQRQHESRPQLVICASSQQNMHLSLQLVDAVRIWCTTHDYTLQLVTAGDVYSSPRLANIKLLRRFATDEPSPDLIATILGIVMERGGTLTMAQLAEATRAPYEPAISAICYLAYHHMLVVPMNTEHLCGDSAVFSASEAYGEGRHASASL